MRRFLRRHETSQTLDSRQRKREFQCIELRLDVLPCIRKEIRYVACRLRMCKHQATGFVGQRVQTPHQFPVANQSPCPVTTRRRGYDDGANGAIRAGDAVPHTEHEDRRVQAADGAESPGQFDRIPNRSVDDILVNMPGDAIPITSWRMSSGSSIALWNATLIRASFSSRRSQIRLSTVSGFRTVTTSTESVWP